MAIGRETALEILNEAKAAGYEDQPVPETDEEIIARAQHFYDEAKKLWDEQGDLLKDKDVRTVVQSIIFLGDSPLPGETGIEETYPRRSSGGLSEGDERETDNFVVNQLEFEPGHLVIKEHLPVPYHIEGDPDPMPRDLSTLTDKEVRRLSGEYNAYLARVTYLLGVESSDLANAEHLLEAAKAKALRGLNLVDPNGDGKKQKLAKVIDSEILADENVAELTRNVSQHQQMVIVLKSLKEIYGGNIDRLSREWTMRQNEWEKSR